MLKRPILLSAAMLFALGACSVEKAGNKATEKAKPTGKAKIACEHPEFNYGKVGQGTVVKHIYKIKNVGGEFLTIKSASGG